MSRFIFIAMITILYSGIPVNIEIERNSIKLKSSSAYAYAPVAEAIRIDHSGRRLNDRATTVLEVVLNEMAGSAMVGKQNAFNDALNIASVIANRAAAAGVSQQAVVSVRQEFNGYGIPLRPGAKKDLRLARRAVEYVSEHGAQHKGMFYATPACVKYLPRGLKSVARSAGHVFFVDPARRSYKTAHGYRRPDPSFFTYNMSLLDLKTIEPSASARWVAEQA